MTRRWLLLGVVLVLVASAASLAVGARSIPPDVVWTALVSPSDAPPADAAVVASRIPRTLTGLLVGAGLAVAGAAMQGMTRNPLADPGLLGLNAGAAAAVVLGIHLLGVGSVLAMAGLAFFGAALATAVVYAIAALGSAGPTPIRLALAGAATTAGLSAITSAVLLLNQQALEQFRFWQVGVLGARDLSDIALLAPAMGLGILALLLLSPVLNALALGDDAATGLGIAVGRSRLVLAAAVVLLAGSAVSLAGPIGFLGLLVPHAARLVVGGDYPRIMLLCLFGGPTLLLVADVIGRIVLPPAEVQAGVMTALLGVPVFIALVRRRREVGL